MTERTKGSILFEIALYTCVALCIVIPFRFFIAQPFIVSGASMLPTIAPREYLVIDVLSHTMREPERGEVIIFRYPFDTTIYFVKRVIGLPGETVVITDGAVTVEKPSGELVILTESYVFDEYRTHETQTTVLGADEYFVMGDNRKGSSDSRVWGPLQKKFIVGYALLRLYPFERFALHPGRIAQ
jgi:signal peptidase I